MEIGYGEEQVHDSELRQRCQPWKVDDPLANHLKGVPNPIGLRAGTFLKAQTIRMFDELRNYGYGERLYSFFRKDKFPLSEVWRDMMPTNGQTWVSKGEIQNGVKRYDGLPLDGVTRRVMDVHNHPEGYPESASGEDTAFFLNDMDMKAQIVVSEKGTQIMVKPQNYSPGNFNQEEFNNEYRECSDRNSGNPNGRDKEFAIWTAKRYKLQLLWVKKGSNFVGAYR